MLLQEEAIMEKKLIEQLAHKESRWVYREDIKNEDQLWDNFFKLLEMNNLNKLNDVMLTEKEKEQIKVKLNFTTFYEAAVFLRGENGIAKLDLQREDASLKTVRLDVVNSHEIAGGHSTYEIINQFSAPKQDVMNRDRFFDVTLLINGIPMIHIELKSRRTSYMEAFRQIKKYIGEGQFTGLFSLVQMFVVSNGTDTRYIAASSRKLNDKFLTSWVNEDNEPVSNYLDFAGQVLTIPEAHQMVSHYSVLDSESESIILLRPYQIHAIKAVREAMKRQESGYVWHTTGSGKTLTSYKVANNLLQIPALDKSIFIVDRKDLDNQTTSAFQAYAQHDGSTIDDTDNVWTLIDKLKSSDRSVIITTIQKLRIVINYLERQEDDHRTKSLLKKLKVAFVVDEAHRAVTPQQKKIIDTFFSNALWYGFTGTPIFKENARAELGDLARTTEEQYGRCLHQYTVKEAIHDKAVLGFQVEYKSTFDQSAMDGQLERLGKSSEVLSLEGVEYEKHIPNEVYETDEHKLEVINSIVNKSDRKLGLQKGPGQSYTALLTTSSIKDAQRYYELFKEVISGESSVEISQQTRSKINDFPKVAITYSINENEESGFVNSEAMKNSLADYNAMFDTNFTMETIDSYNRDVNNRLARKRTRYHKRDEQLDIVIVVDRLLTGFDAPCLSTLFLDRKPMAPHHLIQAFSRTNRIFDNDKKYGQIVTFQYPSTYKEAVEEAFRLYSNGGERYIQAPEWEESIREFEKVLAELKAIAPKPESVDDILGEEAKMKKFAKVFQNFDNAYSTIQVYSDYDKEEFDVKYGLNDDMIAEYHGKYQNVIASLRDDNGGKEELDIDLEYQIQTINRETVDYEYLLALMENSDVDHFDSPADYRKTEEAQMIDYYIKSLGRHKPKLAKIVKDVWEDLIDHPDSYKKENIQAIISQRVNDIENMVLREFSENWAVDLDDLTFYVENYEVDKDSDQLGESELMRNADYEVYKEKSENPVLKLRYKKTIRDAAKGLVTEEIVPYRLDK